MNTDEGPIYRKYSNLPVVPVMTGSLLSLVFFISAITSWKSFAFLTLALSDGISLSWDYCVLCTMFFRIFLPLAVCPVTSDTGHISSHISQGFSV